MNLILFDDDTRLSLLPFTFTRPVSEIRIGILTIREKWEHYFSGTASWLTEKYLQEKFPVRIEVQNTLINASILPDGNLVHEINRLREGESLVKDNMVIAAVLSKDALTNMENISKLST